MTAPEGITVIPAPDRPPDPYHVCVTPDETGPNLDEAFADSVIGDMGADVVVLVAGPRYLEIHVESRRDLARLGRALAVAGGLLATHGQLFSPGSVVHACWDDEGATERMSA